jgi:hypothetical protein
VTTKLTLLCAGLALLILPGTAVSAPKSAKVKPVIECVVRHDNGTYTASIGYLNPNSFTIYLAAGTARNEFSPGHDDRGQPERFVPGRNEHVFKVTVPTSVSLRWSLDGQTATAHPDYTAPCVMGGSMTGERVRIFWGRGATASGLKAWFLLPCNPLAARKLDVWWNRSGQPTNKFTLSSINYTFCWDDPLLDPGGPWSGFDSSMGRGMGTLNGQLATAEWNMTDRGERSDHRHTGRAVDKFGIVIRNSANELVLAKELLVGEANIDAIR